MEGLSQALSAGLRKRGKDCAYPCQSQLLLRTNTVCLRIILGIRVISAEFGVNVWCFNPYSQQFLTDSVLGEVTEPSAVLWQLSVIQKKILETKYLIRGIPIKRSRKMIIRCYREELNQDLQQVGKYFNGS